jgi:hypothetical protein
VFNSNPLHFFLNSVALSLCTIGEALRIRKVNRREEKRLERSRVM